MLPFASFMKKVSRERAFALIINVQCDVSDGWATSTKPAAAGKWDFRNSFWKVETNFIIIITNSSRQRWDLDIDSSKHNRPIIVYYITWELSNVQSLHVSCDIGIALNFLFSPHSQQNVATTIIDSRYATGHPAVPNDSSRDSWERRLFNDPESREKWANENGEQSQLM